MHPILRKVLRYFLQGIIIISPFIITGWAAYSIFTLIDDIIPSLPIGVGFMLVITIIILIGWLGSTFFVWRFLIELFDNILEKTPFLKFIYTSVKDVVESFMGDKKKFTKPVIVRIRHNPEIWQMGFITQENLTKIGLEDKIAVYLPHSYAVSGYMLIVNKEDVQMLNTMNPTDAMKMAVTGGITGYNEEVVDTKKNFTMSDKFNSKKEVERAKS